MMKTLIEQTTSTQ